jgi:hypothetical protein
MSRPRRGRSASRLPAATMRGVPLGDSIIGTEQTHGQIGDVRIRQCLLNSGPDAARDLANLLPR